MGTTADKIAITLRGIAPEGKLMAVDVPLINQMAAQWDARTTPKGEPKWLVAARSKIGQREIVGPKHNPWIADGWAKLKAGWYNSDETPWCGFFVAWALNEAKLPYPKSFPAAASFRDYGVACAAQVGAIGVKTRKGGNHVFFIVGQTSDRMYYKALGGNQSNMVNIMDIAKSDVDAIRWPPGQSIPIAPLLPIMAKGKISVNEA